MRWLISSETTLVDQFDYLEEKLKKQFSYTREYIRKIVEVNIRDKSILDRASEQLHSQKCIFFLNEHFRSMPRLIKFSNDQFYDSKIHVMTEKPHSKQERSVVEIYSGGKRSKNGFNRIEAKKLVTDLKSIILKESKMPSQICHSLGVLSPFRDQVDGLTKIIEKEIPIKAIKRHRIIVGTVHTFQGEERDIMLISFSLDEQSHPNAFYFILPLPYSQWVFRREETIRGIVLAIKTTRNICGKNK